MKYMDYSERLKKLEMTTLAYRRERGDMIEMWKHFNTYDQATMSPNFKVNTRNNRKNPHSHQLTRIRPSDITWGVQSNSIYFRAATEWNFLAASVVLAENINKFKKSLMTTGWTVHRSTRLNSKATNSQNSLRTVFSRLLQCSKITFLKDSSVK